MYGVDLQNTAHHPDANGPEGDEVTARAVTDTEETGIYPVTIADGMLYGNSGGKKIYALDLETEEIEWEGDVSGSTAVRDGRVYGPISDETLYAYDVDSGDQWESEQHDEIDAFVTHPLPTADGILIASDDAIWGFDSDTGDYTHIIDTPLTNLTTDWPAFADDTLYIGRSDGLHAINVATPEIEWTFQPEDEGGLTNSNPAISDGTVYTIKFTSWNEKQLLAIDADSGEEEWATEIDIDGVSPAVADGTVYLAGSESLVAVNADSGTVEWERGDDIALEPYDVVVANGICYVTTSFRIWARDAGTGDLVWEYQRPDESDIRFSASPTVFDETVYVPSSDDTLYAIEEA
ncbi:PQQ-binding-like beta-propeller repeat protein [Halosolutus amylolyticus]|uniref:PQQ-binding-like beta-propeller repeat protein n=1 Tax=Halosolutus amylolyticus TaxID=2932267 RepID=A0ABD5PLX9_9EURY|nr:PQQ-binding-like beta-propeller repeat protein [Halosolutus amylolyticus]